MPETPHGRFQGIRRHAPRRLQLLLIPLVMAAAASLATPQAALAVTGAKATGVTTYVVNPAKNEIDVTVTYTIHNTTKSKSSSFSCYGGYTCTQTTSYYFTRSYLLVDASAGPVTATSNAGKVSQAPEPGAPSSMRGIKLTYPPVWYGQTRVVTAKYVIPAGPKAIFYRALKSYAAVCATNNVWTAIDSGSVNIVLPAGFKAIRTASMQAATASGGSTTLSTTSLDPYFSSCIEAVNPTGLQNSTATAGNTTFTIESWPEDADWRTRVAGFVNQDVSKIENLTGLPIGDGPFTLAEAGGAEVGVAYDTDTAPIERVASSAIESDLIQAIAKEGYAGTFTQPWMSAGLAGYAGRVIGSGITQCSKPLSPVALDPWQTVTITTSSMDRTSQLVQALAACAVFTEWAKDVGPDRFKAALVAASHGENPYTDAVATAAAATQPISPMLLLDMIDERGMIPAGIGDLDKAQSLLADSGVFDASQLQARSKARAQYHALAAVAATWKLPPVVRNAMARWDFTTATNALNAASQILSLRDQSQKTVTGLRLDGTKLQQSFESAATQADLDAVLALAKSESAAATKVAEASQLQSSGQSILQSIGLLGSDVSGRIDRARSALGDVKPGDASGSAQGVIDDINQSSSQGILRLGVILAALLAVLVGLIFRRRRRRLARALAAARVIEQVNAFESSEMAEITEVQPASPEGIPTPTASEAPALPQAVVADTQPPDPSPPAGP